MQSIPEHIESIIVKALQKTAGEEEEKLLNAWLREDRQHLALYCELKEIWDSKEPAGSPANDNGWNDLYRRLHKKKTLYPYWMRYAAAIFAGVMIASAVMVGLAPRRKEKEIIVQNVVFNQNGVQKLMLPDSSVVWLNERTRLSYPEKFESEKRLVSLEGKVFFEVKKDIGQPFVVQTENVDVQVTGTAFFVQAETEENTVVSLVSGGVIVRVKDKSGAVIQSAQLTPGKQASISKNDKQLSLTDIDTSYFVAWKDGTYRFTDEPLENIAKQLSRHFGLRIVMSPELVKKRFTGRVTPEHKINDVMDIINKSHPIRYSIEKSVVYIRAK